MTKLYRVLAPMIALAGSSAFAQPTMPPTGIWITCASGNRLVRVQGTTLELRQRAGVEDYPIAVWGDIRTACSGTSTGQGAKYTIDGADTGQRHSSFPFSSDNSAIFFDGTTDGRFNYTVNYGHLGGVYRADRNWGNPQLLFPLGGFGQRLGITFDPFERTLWVSSYSNATWLENYSLSGQLLRSFPVMGDQNVCLAFEPRSRTLYVMSRSFGGTFQRYTTRGRLLGTMHYPLLYTSLPMGAEFDLSPAASLIGPGQIRK